MVCGVVYQFKSSLSGLLVGAAAILIVLWLTQTMRYWRRRRKALLDLAAKLPGPPALPLIGNALKFACKPEQFLHRIVGVITPYAEVSPMRFWLGPALHVVVTKPRDIEVIMNSQKAAHKGAIYRFFRPFLGEGLISGSGPIWRSHRKLVAPMFNLRTLECYVESFDKHSQILIKKLKPVADGVEIDILRYLEGCTIDIVSETIMGCPDMNAQENIDQEFIHSTEKMYEIVYDRMLKIWLHIDWIFRLSSRYKEQNKAQRLLRDFTEKLVAEKKMEFYAIRRGESNSYEDRNSILEQLIEAAVPGNLMTDEELRDEIYTIYIASQDTMALLCSFTFLMLGIHADVQDKARKEVESVIGNGEITATLLPDLKYLEMVIKETLRLFPIAPLMVRSLQGDIQLDNCILPGGCDVVIASYVTQRSPEYWKDPEKFIPERFLPEEVAKRHPYTFTPFSGGLMGCIGQKYAMMCSKTIIANILKNYKITSTVRLDGIKLRTDISVRSVNGYKVSLQSL